MNARHLRVRSAFVALLGAAVLSGCGASPTGPNPPAPPPPPVVTPPAITSLTVAATRTEVERTVAVAVQVEDAEKPPAALTYVWSAAVGTFTGTGPSVTWVVPKGSVTTPLDVVLTVTVIEPYQVLEGNQLINREHRVTRESAPIRVHDSVAEISTMVRTFLVDYFGNINVSPDACLVDFSTNRSLCPSGRDAEYSDLVDNRAEYAAITEVQVRVDNVTINDPGTFASVFAPCLFRSQKKNGEREAYAGNCELTAVYDKGRWWLCESYFRNPVPISINGAWPLRRTFGSGPPAPGTFPYFVR